MILHGDELGWRLAGITDGEGCFHIRPHQRTVTAYQCVFTIGLRADDKPLLELLRDSTGLGRIYDITPSPLTLERRPGTNPQAHWTIASKGGCLGLVALFDQYTPISKKRREYLLWADAVRAWQEKRWERMRECWIALGMLRAFEGDDSLADVYVIDNQLALEVSA